MLSILRNLLLPLLLLLFLNFSKLIISILKLSSKRDILLVTNKRGSLKVGYVPRGYIRVMRPRPCYYEYMKIQGIRG